MHDIQINSELVDNISDNENENTNFNPNTHHHHSTNPNTNNNSNRHSSGTGFYLKKENLKILNLIDILKPLRNT